MDDELESIKNGLADCRFQLNSIISSPTPSSGKSTNHASFDPLWTPRQKSLWQFYEAAGVIGIMIFLKTIALDRGSAESSAVAPTKKRKANVANSGDDAALDNSHPSWKRLVKDIGLGAQSRTLFYLSSVCPKVLPCFIRGDLPRRMQEPGFRERVEKYTKTPKVQGVYAAYVSRVNPMLSTQANPSTITHVGKGLTFNQMIRVLETMRKYCDFDDPESLEIATAIDESWPDAAKLRLDHACERRFGDTTAAARNSLEKTIEWLDKLQFHLKQLRDQLKGSPDEHRRFEEHLLRCLVYVGLGRNTAKRGGDHRFQMANESPIFGLYLATVQYCFGDYVYDIEDSTYQVFRTVRVENIGLDEIVASLLLSSYAWDGGLNCTHAGSSLGNNVDRSDLLYVQRMEDSARSIRMSQFQPENLMDA
ncbi:uncharacterized protein HMPREF1541_03116 [Cyphellophora europaea CBS 101466]|uniref:Uncharacterized protein n=1 Tax=Cyphellophora europaea (strain CBS 101466) TaxID=1220924 RepID=W2RXD2_CYPE1|nr:uncharacterized protein HMPREF1541_03116 [Cyphellophora europaea CBS 101466]ETN41181.1 hypothetical protein HMPREF1541_03116 [Cyphellophora europaea CBS 101466]